MDLFAYAQIEELDSIAKDNGIHVPRLRGYRLMKDEEPYENLEEAFDKLDEQVCEDWCRSEFGRWPDRYEYSFKTDARVKKYLISNGDAPKKIRWEIIHGKKRKNLKYAIKKKRECYIKQFSLFNKYAGKNNVLYIHARIGDQNWNYYGGHNLEKQPWFLGKADDYFDCTYCDIYARIK